MKVLFLTSSDQDNLEDAALHGFRTLLGPDCVDYPRKDVLYRGYAARPPDQCYGRLFTLWRTLDEISVDRTDVERRLGSGAFDLVVIGSAHRFLPGHERLLESLDRRRTIALDGEDHSGLAAQALRFPYFKRELHWKARLVWYRDGSARWVRCPVPTALLRVEPVAFSIPAEKIVASPPSAAERPQRFQRLGVLGQIYRAHGGLPAGSAQTLVGTGHPPVGAVRSAYRERRCTDPPKW